MSEFSLSLSWENVCILKALLEQTIERHEKIWMRAGVRTRKIRNRSFYEQYLKEEKENEERKLCLEVLMQEILLEAMFGGREVNGSRILRVKKSLIQLWKN